MLTPVEGQCPPWRSSGRTVSLIPSDRSAGLPTLPAWLGKTDNGIVTVTTVWTDGRVYYPLHATPYTPAHHFTDGRSDPAFRTKPQLAAALAARGKEAGFGCRAVVADCAYSVSDDW